MRRGLIAFLFVIGIGALLYPMLTPSKPTPSPPEQSARPHLNARQEQHMKQQMLKNDVTITEQLCLADCGNHMNRLLRDLENASTVRIKTYVKDLQKDHGHMPYLMWIDRTKNIKLEFGTFPKNMSVKDRNRIKQQLELAKQSVRNQKEYHSGPIQFAGKRYIIMGKSSKTRPQAVIALINQNIVTKVDNHQRKNLRLIPFPSERKYRVKSVDADTHQDIKIDQGDKNGGASHYYNNEVVVRFSQEPTAGQMEQIKNDLQCKHPRKTGYTYIFKSNTMDTEALQRYFKNHWNPAYVEPHYLYMTNELGDQDATVEQPNDSLYAQYQWNLPIIETNKGWRLSKGKEEVIVAVVDTGVDLKHPDLKGHLLPGYNVFDSSKPPQDDVGHGTHVAGIIGAIVNNGEGVAGMTWFNKILPVKALDSTGAGTTYSVAEGIIWAADHGAKVINLSLGNYAEAQFLHDAVKYAYDKDVVIIAATGNDNTERPGYPAAYPEVFAVSATDQKRARAPFSNYGDYVDVVAPGSSIASTYPNNQYAALSGTSMACPHVTALAALIRSENPALTNEQVMDIMRKNVIDLGVKGRDKYFGYGQIDVMKALQAASQQDNTLNFWPFVVRREMERIVKKYK